MSANPQEVQPVNPPAVARVGLLAPRYVLVDVAHVLFGYTVKAMNVKMDTGVWREGFEWIKAPDGRRFVIVDGVERWIAGQPAGGVN
jgi:hypothetical protein